MSEKNPWKTESSSLIYENPWMKVREDQVVRPDGQRGIYGVVETRAATGVIALTPEESIVLVGQYRYPTDCYSWEIPEGGAEAGESPLAAAKRELREETGLRAGSWESLGGLVHLSNCISAESAYLFLATDLQQETANPDSFEVLQMKEVPLSDAIAMVDDGRITDAVSIIGILRIWRRLKSKQ